MSAPEIRSNTGLFTLLTAFLLPAGSAPAQVTGSTVLTFDIAGGGALPQQYGDNVSGPVQGNSGYGGTGAYTPGVSVDYALAPPNGSLTLWTLYYGNLANVVYAPASATSVILTFTASAGSLVSLFGFDVAGYLGASGTLTSVTVRNGGGALLTSLAGVAVPSNPSGHVDVDFNPPPSAQILILEITAPAGTLYNIGLDNVAFGQIATGLPVGQANSAEASLRVNGFGPLATAGPFPIGVAPGGAVDLDWSGLPGMPLVLVTGVPNPAAANLGCMGLLDIGTPPLFQDLVFVFNGLLPGFPHMFFRLGPQGTASQSFGAAGLSGLSASIQGAVLQPAGSACLLRLTAAFNLSFP